MPPKTQTKKALVVGLKTNCKRGYNLLAETQAELTATQKWILDKLMNELSISGETYDELTRFLTDLNISIKVPMLTEMKPYTNKQGKTTMKHYTANGSMVNHLKDDKPVLHPTWTKFYRSKFQINAGGHFTSFADQTVYTLKEVEVEVAPPVEVEVEVKPKKDKCRTFTGSCYSVEHKKVAQLIIEADLNYNSTINLADKDTVVWGRHVKDGGTNNLFSKKHYNNRQEVLAEVYLTLNQHEWRKQFFLLRETGSKWKNCGLTVEVLKNYCKQNKMKGYAKMKKAELITFVMKYEFD